MGGQWGIPPEGGSDASECLVECGGAETDMERTAGSVGVLAPSGASPVVESIAGILARAVESRSEVRVTSSAGADLNVHLSIEPGAGAEGFMIVDAPDGSIRIAGSDERGLLYGVGKFLRTSRFDGGRFVPGAWRGTSAPACPVRGIYFATHLNNFYEAAPADEVERYLEELALWGLNSVACHFPPQQFASLDDPRARRSIDQIRTLMRAAKRIGLRVGLLEALNCGFVSAPGELLHKPFPDDLGRRGNYGVLLCPSNRAGRKYLLGQWEGVLGEFRDIGLDFLVSWPYDEGGCGCEECWPWGARGFLSISRDVSDIYRGLYPEGKFVLSTWVFDTPPAGEWEGLSRAMAEDGSWVDYIMADSHEDFPCYPLDHHVPGDHPLLSFPEISMWGMAPWGGYGANPLPGRCQRLWRQASDRLSGGFPYSEGIYEDINKVLYLQLCWDRKRSAEGILKEYICAEFSPGVATDVLQAIRVLEENHCRDRIGDSALKACSLMEKADSRLSPRARYSWRWRVLLLRARIDRELHCGSGESGSPILARAFAELTEIYHAQEAFASVCPPKVDCV